MTAKRVLVHEVGEHCRLTTVERAPLSRHVCAVPSHAHRVVHQYRCPPPSLSSQPPLPPPGSGSGPGAGGSAGPADAASAWMAMQQRTVYSTVGGGGTPFYLPSLASVSFPPLMLPGCTGPIASFVAADDPGGFNALCGIIEREFEGTAEDGDGERAAEAVAAQAQAQPAPAVSRSYIQPEGQQQQQQQQEEEEDEEDEEQEYDDDEEDEEEDEAEAESLMRAAWGDGRKGGGVPVFEGEAMMEAAFRGHPGWGGGGQG